MAEIDRSVGFIIGLVSNCKLRPHVRSCPLRQLAELPLAELIDRLEQLPSHEVEAIISHHDQCQHDFFTGPS